MDYQQITHGILTDAGVQQWEVLPPWRALRASGNPRLRSIRAAEPVCPITLSTLAHEAGHVATTCLSDKRPILDIEFDAWKWGMEAIKRHGGSVTDAMLVDARKALQSYDTYMGQRIDIQRGVKDRAGARSPGTEYFLKGGSI